LAPQFRFSLANGEPGIRTIRLTIFPHPFDAVIALLTLAGGMSSQLGRLPRLTDDPSSLTSLLLIGGIIYVVYRIVGWTKGTTEKKE